MDFAGSRPWHPAQTRERASTTPAGKNARAPLLLALPRRGGTETAGFLRCVLAPGSGAQKRSARVLLLGVARLLGSGAQKRSARVLLLGVARLRRAPGSLRSPVRAGHRWTSLDLGPGIPRRRGSGPPPPLRAKRARSAFACAASSRWHRNGRIFEMRSGSSVAGRKSEARAFCSSGSLVSSVAGRKSEARAFCSSGSLVYAVLPARCALPVRAGHRWTSLDLGPGIPRMTRERASTTPAGKNARAPLCLRCLVAVAQKRPDF